MKYFALLCTVFAAGCSFFPITSSQIETFWTSSKYTPDSINEIEGVYQSNMLGSMGEILSLKTDGSFIMRYWHSEAKSANYVLYGNFNLSLDTLIFNYTSFSMDSSTYLDYKRIDINLDTWISRLNSSSNKFCIRKVDDALFIISPAEKMYFCRDAIYRTNLYYQKDSTTIGRSYLAKKK